MIGTLRSFDLVQVMTGGGPGRGLNVLARYMYKTIFDQDYGYGAQLQSSFFIMLVFIAIFIQQMIRRDEGLECF